MRLPSVYIAIGAAGAGILTGSAASQPFPTRPLRILTTEAGGSLDFASRVMARDLAGPMGQPVIVENRGGAGGALAIETVARANADGHTLLLYGSAFWIITALRADLSWHPLRDFAPVTLALASPHLLLVHPSVHARSVPALINLARARPADLAYASAGPGSTAHIAAELFRIMTGIGLLHIPHKGGAPALNSLLGGHEQMMFPPVAAPVLSHVEAGRLRALAVTSARPSPLLPDLPTVAGSAVPGYAVETKVGIYVPVRTPKAVVSRLNRELVALLSNPEVRARFAQAAMDVIGSTPEQAALASREEFAKITRIVKDAGIRSE